MCHMEYCTPDTEFHPPGYSPFAPLARLIHRITILFLEAFPAQAVGNGGQVRFWIAECLCRAHEPSAPEALQVEWILGLIKEFGSGPGCNMINGFPYGIDDRVARLISIYEFNEIPPYYAVSPSPRPVGL